MKSTFYQIILTITIFMMSFFYSNAQIMDTTILFKYNKNKNWPALDSIKLIDKHDKVIVDADSNILYIRKIYKTGTILSVSNHGFEIGDRLKKKKKKHKKLHVGMHFDFGINNIVDNTEYKTGVNYQQLVQTDSNMRNLASSDLKLRNAKSINFNFWPVWLKQDIARHNVQIETGLGFQFFNYQFDSQVRHNNGFPNDLTVITPQFEEITDPTRLTGKEKNKFGVSYVSIPLMLRFNSNKKKGHRYFLGAGVIGSYKLKSWTKFYGEKEAGNYGINDWMTQVTAELGVTGVIKIYGTYSLQSMYTMQGQGGLDRRPFALGIRL